LPARGRRKASELRQWLCCSLWSTNRVRYASKRPVGVVTAVSSCAGSRSISWADRPSASPATPRSRPHGSPAPDPLKWRRFRLRKWRGRLWSWPVKEKKADSPSGANSRRNTPEIVRPQQRFWVHLGPLLQQPLIAGMQGQIGLPSVSIHHRDEAKFTIAHLWRHTVPPAAATRLSSQCAVSQGEVDRVPPLPVQHPAFSASAPHRHPHAVVHREAPIGPIAGPGTLSFKRCPGRQRC